MVRNLGCATMTVEFVSQCLLSMEIASSQSTSTPAIENYEKDDRVVLGYGDCHEKSIGGEAGTYAHCHRRPSEMYPQFNSTEEHVYVCECSKM